MTPDTARVLRYHEEPCQHYDDAAVHAAFVADPRGWLDHMDHALGEVATGRWSLELPPKQVFADPDEHADFRVMPCVVRSPWHVRKSVKVVGTNGVRRLVPDQLTVGKAVALHPEENFVSAIFDACALSSVRTGAVAALAARHLARRRRHVAVYGCGRVGYYAIRFLAMDAGIETITLHDPDSTRVEAMRTALAEVPQTPKLLQSPGADAPDLAVLATDSEVPLEDLGDSGATVISMGADTLWQHELPTAMARHVPICVDTRDSLATGDLAAWVQTGAIERGDVIDLLDVVRAGPHGSRPDLFVSTGSALFDNLAIDWLLRRPGAHPPT